MFRGLKLVRLVGFAVVLAVAFGAENPEAADAAGGDCPNYTTMYPCTDSCYDVAEEPCSQGDCDGWIACTVDQNCGGESTTMICQFEQIE